jgi:hypothetical protein
LYRRQNEVTQSEAGQKEEMGGVGIVKYLKGKYTRSNLGKYNFYWVKVEIQGYLPFREY